MTVSYTGVNGGTFPNVIVGPAAGEYVTQASVGYTAQGAANECKHLFDIKANLAGATFTGLVTCNAGLTVPTGQTLTAAAGSSTIIAGGLGVSGTTVFNADVTFNGNTVAADDLDVTGTLILSGRTQHAPMFYATDADQMLTTSGGTRVFQMAPTAATVTRIIKLQTTTAPVPLEGEEIEICSPDGLAGPGSVANFYNYNVQREDGTHIVALYGAGSWAICRFQSGVWRGKRHSGFGDPAIPEDGRAVAGDGW